MAKKKEDPVLNRLNNELESVEESITRWWSKLTRACNTLVDLKKRKKRIVKRIEEHTNPQKPVTSEE